MKSHRFVRSLLLSLRSVAAALLSLSVKTQLTLRNAAQDLLSSVVAQNDEATIGV
jgi:hypothetical protein